MNIQDLGTVAELGLPIKFFVLENEGYGSIRRTQDSMFSGRRLGIDSKTGLRFPDLELISKSFDIPFARLTNGADMIERLPSLLKSVGPMVVEVTVQINHSTEPRVTSYTGADGKIVSSSMHNLVPTVGDRDFYNITGLQTDAMETR